MSNHGAIMQTYNQELVKFLETLKIKRVQVAERIHQEECAKAELEKTMSDLQDKIKHCDDSLEQHKSIYEHYNKVIEEVETGFKKILETSKTLLQVAQHEVNKLNISTNSQNEPI
ncbi:uncharacterized protein LOC109543622 [Dendroctonus ponderosae]|uniref:Uncharacterized protein n=1 Tax=Dendroctonus ponderosae TaxID=77166 RepID=A0AAR5Q6Y8_DENPD|nr:uncharacterized protein LOC109543622 [Dendroctonus ponderosae]XP_048521182.1 uncharacterized protein LOC109543622 [Dendroctonus ponderosae]XP_048521183.1 uncharacterized protein LOC109543622 [Dendroctonus ponderosae]